MFKKLDSNIEAKFHLLRIYRQNYEFPEEDLCYFKSLYFFKKINVEYSSNYFHCSCTLFLLLNISSSADLFLFFKKCNDIQNIEECEIESKLNECNSSFLSKTSKYSAQDLIFDSEILNFLTIFMIPIFCMVAIITNLMNLKILSNIQKDKFSASNKLMMVNSVINLVYSVIYCIHLANKCVYVNGIFCSTVLRERFVQLFDIIFVEFLLSVLKIWSNASIIGISWLRLSLLIKDKPWVKRINKFQEKKWSKIFVICFLVTSIIISVDKLFVVRVNEHYFVMDEIDYEEFPNKNTFLLNNFRDLGHHSLDDVYFYGKNAIIFYVFFVCNFILNDLLVYLILFVLDISILYFFRNTIKDKDNLALKLKIKENSKLKGVKTKVNATVCLNLMIVFILKLAHFGVSFFVFMKKLFSNIDDSNVCFYYSRVCSNYLEFSEQFYILSNAYSIILFRNLNKDFKISFDKIFNIQKSQ